MTASYELKGVAITDWHDVRDTITDQTNTNTIIIGVNTLLALIAACFTVATVISGRVLAQRREIGLLKAIGLTPKGERVRPRTADREPRSGPHRGRRLHRDPRDPRRQAEHR